MEQDLTLLSRITHNRLSDYYVAIFFVDKKCAYYFLLFLRSESSRAKEPQHHNQNNKAMAKPSDKAIEIDALSDRGGRLCHGHVDFVVIVVSVSDSTRYVGIDNNIVLIFYPRKK